MPLLGVNSGLCSINIKQVRKIQIHEHQFFENRLEIAKEERKEIQARLSSVLTKPVSANWTRVDKLKEHDKIHP